MWFNKTLGLDIEDLINEVSEHISLSNILDYLTNVLWKTIVYCGFTVIIYMFLLFGSSMRKFDKSSIRYKIENQVDFLLHSFHEDYSLLANQDYSIYHCWWLCFFVVWPNSAPPYGTHFCSHFFHSELHSAYRTCPYFVRIRALLSQFAFPFPSFSSIPTFHSFKS